MSNDFLERRATEGEVLALQYIGGAIRGLRSLGWPYTEILRVIALLVEKMETGEEEHGDS